MSTKTNPMLVPNDIGKMSLSQTARKHLENTLKNLEGGRAPTPSFKLYGSTSVDVVKKFIIDAAEKHLVPDFVVAYETSRLAKFGPQGGYPKWEDVYETFLLYKSVPEPMTYVDQDILKQMFKEYSTLRCSMHSVDSVLDHLIRSDKIEDRASGDPTFNLKKTDPEAQRIAKQLAKNGKWKQLSGYTFLKWQKLKARVFMPMPFASMLVQAQYFVPFLGNIQQDLLAKGANSPFAAWADKVGFEKCFDMLEREIKLGMTRYPGTLVWYKTDFEKMDTCTASDQYNKLFIPVMKSAFGGQDSGLADAMLFTTTAPIISPSGTMTGDHGTASGAEVTNGGESVCNDYYQRRFLKILKEMTDKVGLEWHLLARRFNGDDGIFGFSLKDDSRYNEFGQLILDAAEQTSVETKFKIQRDKQEVSKEMTTYCQIMIWWQDGKLCYGYPCALCLNNIINPMHEYTPAQWDKDYRDIDVGEKLDGCWHHPWFYLLCDYVAKGMKFPLFGRTEKETARILSKYDKYRSLQTLGERYNRQDYHISNSHAVNYILSQRG